MALPGKLKIFNPEFFIERIERLFFLKLSQLFSAIVAVGFVGGMRVPTEVYITAPSSHDKSGIETDLRAPAQTASISQYHQVPTQDQFLYAALLHNVHFLPFDVSDVKDDGNTYKVYRPDPEEDPQFVDMQPPTIGDEPNYYASEKPRKSKKYSKAVEEGKQKKHLTKDDKKSHESVRSDREVDVKGSQSEHVERQPEQDEQSDDYEYSDSVEQSEPASRLDFQLHGNN